MDKPRHPKGFGPGKPSKHKKINGARPRQNHGESAPGNFSALSAADRPSRFQTLRLSVWLCDESAPNVVFRPLWTAIQPV
jgi:hypothetical protein